MGTKRIATFSAGGGGPVQITGGPTMLHMFVFLSSTIICRLYKLTVSDQTQVMLQLTVGLANLVVRFLAGPPLLGGGGQSRSRRPCFSVIGRFSAE
jgi:hypothetical protein